MTEPRIGLSARVTGEPGRQHTGVHIDYTHSVTAAGGVPLILAPAIGPSGAAEALAACHGLLLTGGEDLLPEHSGLRGTEHVRDTDPDFVVTMPIFSFANLDRSRWFRRRYRLVHAEPLDVPCWGNSEILIYAKRHSSDESD